MINKNFWLRTLNVRPDEGWLVKRLFLLQFFQGAGIAFFYTAAFALFLTRLPITELPYVFIYSSILLWGVGFIYSRIEHKFEISKLAIIITIFMAVSMLAFRLAFGFIEADWFLYWMLAWFNVLYLLNNLEFWGLASLLFDVRQSKRLFGIISAGDIPAKFIGYSLAVIVVTFIGTINLLWIGLVCMLASIPFLISIEKSGKLHQVHHNIEHTESHASGGLIRILKNFYENTLIRRLSMLSIIITGSFIIINYAFYDGVKEAFHDDVSLARFIAFFLAIVRIIALVVKLIFTGRLINRLGITQSLLITPVALLILISSIILSQNIPGAKNIIFYIFGATYIVVDILRSAINSPVFLTIMQPLPGHERLKAHTILKGIMDPFAMLIAGTMLWLLVRYLLHVELVSLSYILMAICILWIIGIYRVNSQYLKTIVKSISSRYFNLENFSVSDSGTLDWLKEKAKKGTETEIINILNMLYNSNNVIPAELLNASLQHPSEKVKLAAIKLIQENTFQDSNKILLPFLQVGNSPLLVAETLKTLCRNKVDNQIILPYLENREEVIRKAALSGLYFFGTEESKQQTTAQLKQLMKAEKDNDRMIVAEILGMQDHCDQIEMVLQLMNDNNVDIRKIAMMAAGKSGNELLLQGLINRIDKDPLAIIQPLFIAGDQALPFIVAYINEKKATSLQKEKLILLLGRKGGSLAQGSLLNLLSSHPGEYMLVLKALYRSHFHPKTEDQPVFISVANILLTRCTGIIYMQSSLELHREKYRLLIDAFNLELNGLRECLLYIFALLYDREHIKKVRKAYATGKKSSIINAMEIIDLTVRKDFAISFNTIFEPGNITERMHDLRKIYPVERFINAEPIMIRILAEEKRPYNNWTLACAIYTSKKQHHAIDSVLIKKYIYAENLLLRETAVFALQL